MEIPVRPALVAIGLAALLAPAESYAVTASCSAHVGSSGTTADGRPYADVSYSVTFSGGTITGGGYSLSQLSGPAPTPGIPACAGASLTGSTSGTCRWTFSSGGQINIGLSASGGGPQGGASCSADTGVVTLPAPAPTPTPTPMPTPEPTPTPAPTPTPTPPPPCEPFIPSFAVSSSVVGVGVPVQFTADTSLISDPNPAWDLGDGNHRTGNPLSHSYGSAGNYSVVLTATESNCNTAQLSAPITIQVVSEPPPPPPPPSGCDPHTPTFTVWPANPATAQAVTFTADTNLITDPDPAWDLGNGTHLRGNPLVYGYPDPGSYSVVLTATESRCGTAQVSDPVVVDVGGDATPVPPLPPPPPGCTPAHPRFLVSEPFPAVGQEILLEADPSTIADPNPAWDLGNGDHMRGNPLPYTYLAPGGYSIVLTATESECNVPRISSPLRVTVSGEAAVCGNRVCETWLGESCASCLSDCARTPSFTLSTTSPAVGQIVTFSADPDSIDDPSPIWDFGNGVQLESNGPTIDYPYPDAGQYKVRLTATDARCGQTQLSRLQSVSVLDCKTSCAAGCANIPAYTVSNWEPSIGEEIVFRAEPQYIADPEPAWDLGNGEHRRGLSTPFSYDEPGEYPVVLTATENRCYTSQMSAPASIVVTTCGDQRCDPGEERTCRVDCGRCRVRCTDRPCWGPDGGEPEFDCTPLDDAEVEVVGLPSTLEYGVAYEPFVVTMKNTGSTTWTAAGGYALASLNPSDPFTLESESVSNDVVTPGDTGVFRLNLFGDVCTQAESAWRMRGPSGEFGESLAKLISARCPDPGGGGGGGGPGTDVAVCAADPTEISERCRVQLDDGQFLVVDNDSSYNNGVVAALVVRADRSTRTACVNTSEKGLFKGEPEGDRVFVADTYMAWFDYSVGDPVSFGPGFASAWSRSGALSGWWTLQNGGFRYEQTENGCLWPPNELLPGSASAYGGMHHWDKGSPPTEQCLTIGDQDREEDLPESFFCHHYAQSAGPRGEWRTTLDGDRTSKGVHYKTEGKLANYLGQTDIVDFSDTAGNPPDIKESMSSSLEYICSSSGIRVRWRFENPQGARGLSNVFMYLWADYAEGKDRDQFPTREEGSCDVDVEGGTDFDQFPARTFGQLLYTQSSQALVRRYIPPSDGLPDTSPANGPPLKMPLGHECETVPKQNNDIVQQGEGVPDGASIAVSETKTGGTPKFVFTRIGTGGNGSGADPANPIPIEFNTLISWYETYDGTLGFGIGRPRGNGNLLTLQPDAWYGAEYTLSSIAGFVDGATRPSVGVASLDVRANQADASAPVGVVVEAAKGFTTGPVELSYSTLDGSAVANHDYVPVSGTLTFPAGTESGATQFVDVPLLDSSIAGQSREFQLEVWDAIGADLPGPAVSTVTIDPEGETPLTASPGGPYATEVEEALVFDGSGSEPNASITSYAWDFGDGASGSGVSPSHVYSAPGRYAVALTVSGSSGLAATDATDVMVSAADNGPPSVTLPAETTCHPTPSTPCQVVVSATASDPDGDPLTFTWSGCTPTAPGEATCTVTDLSARPIGVVVSDGRGGEASAEGTVLGLNSPPTCWSGSSSLCGVPYCGLMVQFYKADPDGDALTQQCPGADTIWPGGGCRFPGQESGSSNYGGAVVSDPWGATGSCGVNLRWHGACWRCDG